MLVPFISKRSDSKRSDGKLYRRKGGGGRGGGGGGRSGGSSGSKGSSGKSVSVSSGGSTKSATAYGVGGGAVTTIGAGQLFAGRTSGGGTREQVVGTRTYGSGYPGYNGRGVGGLGFPFVFWPLAWGGAGVGGAAYLHNTEYGRWDNSSRPGGVEMTAAFSSSSQNTTFRLMADQASVTSLIEDIVDSCRGNLSNPDAITATNYTDTVAAPRPEQAVQYYRASSVVLSLDGYNNTGALGPEGTPDSPLPENIDTNLLNCLNVTIAEAVPLVDATNLRWSVPSSTGLLGLAYLVWCLSGSI